MNKKIAVIGGGVAGLTAGYLLHKKYEVSLYESSGRLGGNAYTHTLPDGTQVDIAAAAFSDKDTYTNFNALLEKLNIPVRTLFGAFMACRDLETNKALYISPLSAKGLWLQKFEMFWPNRLLEYGRLLAGIQIGINEHKAGKLAGKSFQEFLDTNLFISGSDMSKVLFLCAICLLSSMSGREVLDAPADFVLGKFSWMNLLSPAMFYKIIAPTHRTKSYVDALAAPLAKKTFLNSKIASVVREGGKVTVVHKNGDKEVFDHVVFGCAADTALKLLDKPTEKERKLLGAWKFRDGTITLHRDHSSFPAKEMMTGFMFLYKRRPGHFETSVSGGMWALPGVPFECDYISSQHANFPIKKELIELDTFFRTPVYDNASYATLKYLPTLNGGLNSYYCGSYFGYGLHEDAVTSAVRVAEKLGVPF